jgi:glycine cleavage system H protein
MNVPDELRYSAEHQWARLDGGRVRVGITDYAQDALGEVLSIDLPELDSSVSAGEVIGEVESSKSVSDVFSPVTGRVVEVNAALFDEPAPLNDDPYGEGWICLVEVADSGELEGLLDAAAYRALTEE